MNSKEYTLPNGKKAVFEYDHDGIGKITIEAMDMLMGLIADGRKRGEWLWDDGYFCSECHKWAIYDASLEERLFDFCPNCGAKMKGADDE